MKKEIYFLGNKLYLEIIMVGYKYQGESLIISLKDSRSVPLWTGVIDCYKNRNINFTCEKLKEMNYGKKSIDLLMITHPDEDHIKDISNIINNFTDNSTIYIMPDFINSNIKDTKDIQTIKECICKRYETHESGQYNNIFYNRNINESNLCWKFIGNDNKRHVLKIETYLPTDSIMSMSRYHNPQQKNEYSLFVNLIIDNQINFVFSGDCLDYSLKLLDEEDFNKMKNTLYFKIPHHGSKETKFIKEIIKNENIILTSTAVCAYRKDVTDNKILEFYNNYCKDCVSVTAKDDSKYEYGILKHVYDVVNGYLIKDFCKNEGNACLNMKA